jgi:hypothetical protein
MATVDDDGRPTVDVRGVSPEPPPAPLQAYLPNLDKVSRSNFAKGTVSRRRIIRSAWLLLSILGGITVFIAASALFPR